MAAYWASKLSYMKRVISDVLPTDCSPRKTSLNFRRGLDNVDSAMLRDVVGLSGKRYRSVRDASRTNRDNELQSRLKGNEIS